MLKSRKVSFIAGVSVFALLILIGLFGCTILLQDGSKEGDWYIKLKINNPATTKAITVTEYDVIGLAIEVYDPAGQEIDSIAWGSEEGLMSYLIPVSQEGLHKIEVTHIGEKNGVVVEAEESATFNIQAMVITVIDIIPGSIGVINVEPDGEANSPPSSASSTRLYTLDIPLDLQGPNTVSGHSISESGVLTAMSESPYPSGGEGRQKSSHSGLVASPNGNFIFASHNAGGGIEVYSVNKNGNLRQVLGSPFATSGFPMYLAMHPSGKFLYTTLNRWAVEGFVVNSSTGALTPMTGSPFNVGTEPRDLVVHPKGDFLYTGHMFDSDTGLRVHAIDPVSGALTFSSSLKLSSYCGRPGNRITIDTQGTRLFCTNLDRGIFVADIDPATGSLTLVPGAPYRLATPYVGGMATTTRGDFLYVTVVAGWFPTYVLHGFRVEPSGDLEAVPGSPYSNVGGISQYLLTDGADHRLFVSSCWDNHIRVYDIHEDGSLSEVVGSPFVNTNPAGVVGPILLQ